jgi:hypothetical protein
MKCPFTVKALRSSLLVCVLVGGVASNDACAEAIEMTFYKAETMLKKCPSQLAQFKVFKETVHTQLRNFLDINNKESYATHVGYMEQNARDFHANFVINPAFKCIQNLTTALHADMVALLTLLKSHIGTRSPATLGLALAARFEHLLPKVILKEVGGAFKLQSILDYRLSC